jgi:uncharacterized lipoprotein YddW (UPF0748 family)
MRATWLATVGNIDWPKTTGSAAQKAEMIKMLDSIQALNLNTVFFQVRSRCDAMYNSAYEPWSSDLKIPRGATPDYDPLQFVIDECHKRGIECHAWLNPYRYNNSGSLWSGSNNPAMNYQNTHPEWLLTYSSYIILDPALPEVRQQIKNVVGDIMSKYDSLDGIIFDDYFYPYGGTNSEDVKSQTQYFPVWSQANPGRTVHDWRRDNVNRMVAEVYDTIQAVKPHLTFGISPFGIWTTYTNVAAEEGIPLPAGITGGNMYQEIYCDPVAWLKEGTVDYISPQLYWKIGGPQDYNTLCTWWTNVANRFGKQFYSSMALYRYAENSSNNTLYYKNVAEFRNQTLKNRSANNDNAPGAVFYNTQEWVYDAPFRNDFRINAFKRPALPPAIHWKPAPEQEPVSFVGPPQGGVISWTHNTDENVCYAVYAVPNAKRNEAGAFSKSENLVAITYDKKFSMKTGASTSTHKIAVSVIDRYGNEYAPRVFGESVAAPVTAALAYPAGNDNIAKATLFQWQGDASVDCYIFQVSRNREFTDLVASMETTDTKYNLGVITSIADNAAYWWRVKTRKANASDTWSEARLFTIGNVSSIDTPEANEIEAYAYQKYGSHYLNIRSNEASNATLDVYSVSGKRLSSKPIYLSEGDNEIPLSLPVDSGMYIAKIQAKKKQFTVKIID